MSKKNYSRNKKSVKKIYSWKSISALWPDIKPPLRPSNGEMKIYENFLRQVIKTRTNKLTALLFGATPEIRDLLAKYTIPVTLVDINSEMVGATTALCQQKKRKEKIIINDWLNFRIKQKFDLILGDHITSNIVLKNHPKLYQQFKRHLKDEGFLITNVHLRALSKRLTLQQFIDEYRRNQLLRKDREKKWYWLYSLVYNNPSFYQEKHQAFFWPSTEELLKQAKKKKIELELEEAEKMADAIHMFGSYSYVTPKRQEFEQGFKKYFKIIDSDINKKKPVYRSYRIYFAQPR